MKNNLLKFYKYLENKGYSINTLNSYKKDLEQFLVFSNNINIKDIILPNIELPWLLRW